MEKKQQKFENFHLIQIFPCIPPACGGFVIIIPGWPMFLYKNCRYRTSARRCKGIGESHDSVARRPAVGKVCLPSWVWEQFFHLGGSNVIIPWLAPGIDSKYSYMLKLCGNFWIPAVFVSALGPCLIGTYLCYYRNQSYTWWPSLIGASYQ